MGVTVSTDPPEVVYDLSDLSTVLNFIYQWEGNYTPPLGYESSFQHYSATNVAITCSINNGSPFNLYTGSRGYIDVDLSGGYTSPGWVDSTTQSNTENGVSQPEASNILESASFSYMALIPHSLTLSGAAHGFLTSHSYNFSQRRTAEVRAAIRMSRLLEILALYPNATITFQTLLISDQTVGWDSHGAFVIEKILSTQTTTLPETTFDLSDFLSEPVPGDECACEWTEAAPASCGWAETDVCSGEFAEALPCTDGFTQSTPSSDGFAETAPLTSSFTRRTCP